MSIKKAPEQINNYAQAGNMLIENLAASADENAQLLSIYDKDIQPTLKK